MPSRSRLATAVQLGVGSQFSHQARPGWGLMRLMQPVQLRPAGLNFHGLFPSSLKFQMPGEGAYFLKFSHFCSGSCRDRRRLTPSSAENFSPRRQVNLSSWVSSWVWHKQCSKPYFRYLRCSRRCSQPAIIFPCVPASPTTSIRSEKHFNWLKHCDLGLPGPMPPASLLPSLCLSIHVDSKLALN